MEEERSKEKIREDLSKLTAVTSLCFDVSDRTTNHGDNFKQIDILINNAGNAHGLDKCTVYL